MSTEDKKRDDKKKSLLDKLAERFGFQRKPKGTIYEELKLGDGTITALLDKKLGERIETIDILMCEMNKEVSENLTSKQKVKELKTRLDLLDEVIQKSAAPYARGGDNPKYSRLMHGWNATYSIASSWIQRTMWYFTEDDNPSGGIKDMKDFISTKALSDNAVIIHNLQLSLIQHIFPDAKDVLCYCYKDADVRPSLVTIIQSMMPPTGRPGVNINQETADM
jgi:hypothetical protein